MGVLSACRRVDVSEAGFEVSATGQPMLSQACAFVVGVSYSFLAGTARVPIRVALVVICAG